MSANGAQNEIHHLNISLDQTVRVARCSRCSGVGREVLERLRLVDIVHWGEQVETQLEVVVQRVVSGQLLSRPVGESTM